VYAQGEQAAYKNYTNVADYLAAGAQVNSEAIALRFENESVSYQALHEQSEQLALYLQQQGLRAQAPIALCLDRSVNMVVALLAALKAGSPYLPLDPELPQERLDFMIADSGAQFVLTQTNYVDRFISKSSDFKVLDFSNDSIKEEIKHTIADAKGELQNSAQHDDLFNIIYTSGSTGNPKGVMVTHGGILNRIQWMQSEYQLNTDDKVLQKTTYSFDVSVWEFIWPLSQGASLVLAKPDGHKDPEYLTQLMLEENISHCHFVPSMLLTWLETDALENTSKASGSSQLKSLQKVFCSGEALSREAVNQFYEVLPDCELHNLYGPTEAAIDVSYWHCEKGLDSQCMVPIGKPVSNTQLWVLDSAGQLLAPGVAGELHIGGVQLARGYLSRGNPNLDKLNATTFVEHEINGVGVQRLYKTGDLVRQRRDGVIEYLGRIDHQVKIRGYRIELGEIESRLQSIESVALSVVVAAQLQADSDQQLVAYISTQQTVEDKELLSQSIKAELGKHLPSYMVPNIIMVLDELPLLNNGKINRKALPKAELQQAEFVAPRTETEITLAGIWQEVLGVEEIGIHDNFFELGGHSLLATRVVAKVRSELDVELKLRLIFELKTLEEMAALIGSIKRFALDEQDDDNDLEEIDL
jgi:amino acid adenylation domain-containing protein